MSAEHDSAQAAPAPRSSGRRLTWPERPRRELAAFLATALLVLLVVSAGTIWISERIARATALAEAERSAIRLAEFLVQPPLANALAGDDGAWQELDRVVSNRLGDGSVSRLLVWRASGEILWASDPDLIGRTIAPSEELLAAIGGETVSDVDEAPETAPDQPGNQLEVYVPLTVDGEQLAVESYFPYGSIDRQAALLRGEIIPMAIGALVLLQVVQIPIATSLARRVRRQEAERAELMQRTVAASDRERRAIASDVHDGPVQDLAGVSYALSALKSSVPPERQATVDKLVVAVRHAVQSLRRLMIDIYPPDLSGAGLGTAIGDLAEGLRGEGVRVMVDAAPLPDLSPDAAAVLYRTAKEALANVAKHAKASQVWVTLEEAVDAGAPAVRLEIADDGVGFPEVGTDRRSEGHLGLSLLRDRVIDLGGSVTLGERAGGGALLTAVVPVGHPQ
jgi:two-component system, NarL family, sensor kinase